MGNCFAGVAPVEKKALKAPEPCVPTKEAPKNEERPAPEKAKKADEDVKQNIQTPPEVVDRDTTKTTYSAPVPVSDPPSSTPNAATELCVGNWVDVYSNSSQSWCPGIVYDVDDSSYFAAYQVPGEPQDSNINTKTLPKDCSEIKVAEDNGAWSRATVEVVVLDEAQQKTLVIGRITDFSGGVATIKDLAGEKTIAKLPREDKNIALPGADNAMQYRQGPLMVGSPVEIYSNSMQCWCYGVVERISAPEPEEGDVPIVTVAFFYPDMDPQKEEPAVKELPMNHPDMRVPVTPALSANAVSKADLQIGASIEVYSESRQSWLLGIVKELTQEDTVVMMLKYPDMPEENNLFEKELPIGHAYMRLPSV